MKRLLLLLALALPSFAQVAINDTVSLADGTPWRGYVEISWPAFTTASGTAVARGTRVVAVTSGTLAASLFPNEGGSPTVAYTATFRGKGANDSWTETWSLATSPSVTTLATVRRSSTLRFYPSQIIATGKSNGTYCIQVASEVVSGLVGCSGGGGGGGSWGAIVGTITDQTDLKNALDAKAASAHGHAISDVTALQPALDAKAATSHGHSIADVTNLQTGLNGKQAISEKGQANGYAPLDAGGKVPAANLPASSGMTAVVQDVAPQMGGPLDMNGFAIQTVTPTEMAFVHGLTSPLQPQIDGKAATGHNHAGTYEPVDTTLLRQANLAGTGAATTPARSDHNHSGTYEPANATILKQANLAGSGSAVTPAKSDHNHSGTYEPADATLVKSSGAKTQDAITVFDAAGKAVASGCKIVSGVLSCGNGTVESGVILPELAANGSNDFRIYGAANQTADGCIVLSGAVGSGEALVGSASTVTIDGKVCRVMSATTPSSTYPGAGVPNSTGSAWGTSYTVGSAANNLPQLDSGGKLLVGVIPSLSATYQPTDADLTQIAALSCAANEVVKRNTGNTAWVCAADATGAAGTDLDTATGTIATAQIENNAVTPAKLAFIERQIVISGTGTGGVLQDTDDQPAVWMNQSGGNMTIAQVWCQTDSATALTLQLQKDDGSPVDMLSSNLSCSSTKANTTTFVSTENVLADGNNLNAVIVSAGGGAHWVSVHLKVTY